MKYNWHFLWLALVFGPSFSLVGFGQTKFEVEHVVRTSEVPSVALEMVNALPLKGKVKWYYEENLKGNSYEAKNKSYRHQYSIEFDTLGNFQDIEINLPWKDMHSATQTEVLADLENRFDFHKIRKIQVQYNDPNIMDDIIGRGELNLDYPHLYEIVIEGKQNNLYQLFELTYTQEGQWLKTYSIAPGNTDVLEY